MRWASLLLTLPAICYSAQPFWRGAWASLLARAPGMDVPVALGIAAAFGGSVAATVRGQGEVYFDSVTMFVFFLLGGRYLEMTARQKALSVTEALARLMPAFSQKMPNFPVDRSNRVQPDARPAISGGKACLRIDAVATCIRARSSARRGNRSRGRRFLCRASCQCRWCSEC